MSLALTFNLRTALIVIAALPVYAAVKFLIGQFSHKPEYDTKAEMESFQTAAEEEGFVGMYLVLTNIHCTNHTTRCQ